MPPWHRRPSPSPSPSPSRLSRREQQLSEQRKKQETWKTRRTSAPSATTTSYQDLARWRRCAAQRVIGCRWMVGHHLPCPKKRDRRRYFHFHCLNQESSWSFLALLAHQETIRALTHLRRWLRRQLIGSVARGHDRKFVVSGRCPWHWVYCFVIFFE